MRDKALTSWSPEFHWERHHDSEKFEKIFTSWIEPTGAFVWVGRNIKTKNLQARKSTENLLVKVDWIDPGCTAHTELYPRHSSLTPNKKKNNAFDDADLSKLLATSPKGVIFAYSDRMHLSLDAKAIIERVGRNLGIPVLFLADPESTTTNGTRLESSRLIGEGMTLHYPSVLVYSHGKITSPMMPGYKSESIYSDFIKEYTK